MTLHPKSSLDKYEELAHDVVMDILSDWKTDTWTDAHRILTPVITQALRECAINTLLNEADNIEAGLSKQPRPFSDVLTDIAMTRVRVARKMRARAEELRK